MLPRPLGATMVSEAARGHPVSNGPAPSCSPHARTLGVNPTCECELHAPSGCWLAWHAALSVTGVRQPPVSTPDPARQAHRRGRVRDRGQTNRAEGSEASWRSRTLAVPFGRPLEAEGS
jgi:hypothetical protein